MPYLCILSCARACFVHPQMQDDIACLDIAPVPEGSARCRFLVVGTYDSRIRIVGLNPDDGLRFLALQVGMANLTASIAPNMNGAKSAHSGFALSRLVYSIRHLVSIVQSADK